MLHVCVQRFDMTEILKKFAKNLGTKQALNLLVKHSHLHKPCRTPRCSCDVLESGYSDRKQYPAGYPCKVFHRSRSRARRSCSSSCSHRARRHGRTVSLMGLFSVAQFLYRAFFAPRRQATRR
jgi:hypothetical protein